MMFRVLQSRRDFVKTLGVGAAAGMVLPAFGEEAKWKMRLATSSIQFRQLTLEEACQKIAGLGFEAIDIWDAFEDCKHLEEAEKLGGAGLKELLAKHNLKLSAFTVYKTGYEKYAELLGSAGGGVAVRGCDYDGFTTEKLKKFLEGLKPLVELAEKHNSYIAIENHVHTLLNQPDSFKAFVELNTSPRIGIALAPYHLQSIKASVPDIIRTCGKQLFFFYAWQNAGGLKQLPGQGPADFKPWLDAMAEIKYERYVNPFMHGQPETEKLVTGLAQSIEYLKKLSQ